jgi:hypothetical protein
LGAADRELQFRRWHGAALSLLPSRAAGREPEFPLGLNSRRPGSCGQMPAVLAYDGSNPAPAEGPRRSSRSLFAVRCSLGLRDASRRRIRGPAATLEAYGCGSPNTTRVRSVSPQWRKRSSRRVRELPLCSPIFETDRAQGLPSKPRFCTPPRGGVGLAGRGRRRRRGPRRARRAASTTASPGVRRA